MDPTEEGGAGAGKQQQQRRQREPGSDGKGLAAEAEPPQDAGGDGEEVAENDSPYSVTQVSSLYAFRTFSATFSASSRELKGPMRTRYMVWPFTSTGERKA